MPKFNQEQIFSVVVGVLIVALLMWAYNKYVASSGKPSGAITQAEYDALTPEVKATYIDDPNSIYFIKKAA